MGRLASNAQIGTKSQTRDAFPHTLKGGAMNVWVVKCSAVSRDGHDGWEWDEYFFGDCPEEPFNFGGEHWIRSNSSRKRIRDDMRPREIVVCYQTDTRSIVGFTTLESAGYEELEGSGRFNAFDLAPADDAIFVTTPVTVKQLRRRLRPSLLWSRNARNSIRDDTRRMVEHSSRCPWIPRRFIRIGWMATRKCL